MLDSSRQNNVCFCLVNDLHIAAMPQWLEMKRAYFIRSKVVVSSSITKHGLIGGNHNTAHAYQVESNEVLSAHFKQTQ